MSIVHSLAGLLPRVAVLYVKFLKQSLYRFVFRKPVLSTKCEYRCISKNKTHVFFGYYDVSPFNEYSDEIVYLNLSEGSSKVKIVRSHLSNLQNEDIISESKAWSWQQGVRLRWMPSNNRQIVFNDFIEGKYVSRIVNVDNKTERILLAPLYDISPDGNIGLSVDFERLESKRAGYGYSCRPYVEEGKDLKNEGIDLVHINENIQERIITYEAIAKAEGNDNIDFKNAYINHISFSPSGKYFLFFWIVIIGDKHKASLMVYSFENKQIMPIETVETVSHYVWDTDERIICTVYDENHNCSYFKYDIVKMSKEYLDKFPNRDGHPSIFENGDFLTDTYPDLNGFQRIYKCNMGFGYEELLSVYSTCLMEGKKRTDLHPRISPNNKCICFDANLRKYREIFIINLQ